MPKGISKNPEVTHRKLRLMRLGKKNPFYGKKHSPETIEKIRKASLGNKYSFGIHPSKETRCKMSRSHKGLNNWTKDTHLSEETKRKISISTKGRVVTRKTRKKMSIHQIGEKSHRWKGGLSKIKGRKSEIRRLRQINAIGFHGSKQWHDLKNKYKDTCPSCKKSEPQIILHKDHIIPLSRNGTDFIDNIQPLCKICNSKKGIKIIKYEI